MWYSVAGSSAAICFPGGGDLGFKVAQESQVGLQDLPGDPGLAGGQGSWRRLCQAGGDPAVDLHAPAGSELAEPVRAQPGRVGEVRSDQLAGLGSQHVRQRQARPCTFN
jgi:hypothetical protein